MKYEKPDLEELELFLEGTFLADNTYPGGDKDPEEGDGDDWD